MPRRPDLDALVRLAAAEGLLAAGANRRQIQFRLGLPANLLPSSREGEAHEKAPPWTEVEDDFLRRNLGWLPEAEMAQRLGRTPGAVHLRWKRDLQLPAPTGQPGWLTAHKVAGAMGVDPKTAVRWVDEGRLRGRRLPFKRPTRAVRYAELKAWALNPANWIFFRPDRVAHPQLKRLLALKAQRWNDEWLTAGQAAHLRGVSLSAINSALHAGKLAGVKWGNWRILRSEVMKPGLRFFAGKGGRNAPKVDWSEPADAFLVLASALGYSPEAVAQRMGGQRSRLRWTGKRVAYRLQTLKRSGRITRLAVAYGLGVRCRRGRLFADWKRHRRRFPNLARAMMRLRRRQPLSARDLHLARRVLHTWAAWHGQADIARSLAAPTFTRVGEALKALRRQGIDPYAKPD